MARHSEPKRRTDLMRAPTRRPPPLGILAANALLATLLAHHATPAASVIHQTFIVCKPPNSHLCVVWPLSTDVQLYPVQQRGQRGHWCGLTASPPTPHRFHTVKVLGIEDAATRGSTVYCGAVFLGGGESRFGRVRRQATMTPRGRFRGQTQSQYLAIEHGGADAGKAEAHSAADSSRASVSGNSGMGQAQSQSMYDPSSCDDCYGRTDHEVATSSSGYGPSRSQGRTWDKPSGAGGPTGNNKIGSSPIGGYGPLLPGAQVNQYYGVPGSNNYAPGGAAGVSPQGNDNYRPSQSGISQGPTTGQGGSREPFPGQSSSGGYDPRHQAYTGYTAIQPATKPEQNNNLGNRYGPPQNSGGPGNYGTGMDRSPGGASYAPGSLINPPSRGLQPGLLGSTGSDLQPNHIGSQGNYNNQMKPVGNGYLRGEDPAPGSYIPGHQGVYIPGSDGSLPYGTSRNIIPDNGNSQVSGGVYNPKQVGAPGGVFNPSQPGPSGGIYNPDQAGTPGAIYNPNQAATPGGVYNPNQTGTPGGVYNLNQAGTPGGIYNPNQAGTSSGVYNPSQAGTPGGIYNPNQAGIPDGKYNPNQASTSGSLYNPIQAGTPGGVYNFNQAGTPGTVYNPKQNSMTGEPDSNISPQDNSNLNHGSVPISGPNQISGKNLLDQPQSGNWPLASYSHGGSPYFCCVVGPDGNLMPAKGAPYDSGNGMIKQYPNDLYGRPVFGPGRNIPQNRPLGYVPGQNTFIPGHQERYGSMGPNQDTSANNYGHRDGALNGNGNYRPPANMVSSPGGGTANNENYLIPNLDSGVIKGYRPGHNVGGNEISYMPGVDTGHSAGGSHGTSNGYPMHQNGASGIGNYAPSQGKVDSYVPGHTGPRTSAGINRPGSDVIPNIGGSYGPIINSGKNVDANYNPVPSVSSGFNPDLIGRAGESYNPQQIGSTETKTGYGTQPPAGPGGIGNYHLGQNPTGGVGNYLTGLTSNQRGSYGPGAGYIPYEQRPGADGKNIGTMPSGEPGNIQSYTPGQMIGPISSVYKPSQNGNSNNLLESGNMNPSQDRLGDVANYHPIEGSRQAGSQSPYGSGQDVMEQTGGYPPGAGGQQISNKYGGVPVENGYDQRFIGQNKEYNGVPQNFTDPSTVSDGDDSEAEASVSQSVNGTTASASSRGGNDKGRAQTNVHGTYTGSGSFSAQAQITGENKEAESEVSGGKKGASSSAQGSGRNNKSQANVQLGSETGSVQTQSLTNGAYHSSNSQVQGSIKGGMADAQARGPGSTSSQAQIGFTPYKDGDKAHDLQKIPFVGGGVASAQSSGRTGQSQSQLHGSFKYGISYNGAAQAGGSVDKDAVFPNRLSFDKIDVFDENDKNINVETEKPIALDQSTDTVPPLESVPSEDSMPPNNIPKLSNLMPVATDDEAVKEEETLKNSESRYSSHTHQDHHKTNGQASPTTSVSGATRSFQPGYSGNGAEYEYTTDREEVQPDEYDTDGAEVEQGEYSNYDDIPRDTLTHQSLQSPRKPFEVKQTTGGNTQHIVLDSLDNHDAEIMQKNSERPDESKTYQPGERVPGTGGYTIPAGFTGSVKSVASKEDTYVVGSKESPSQAQTVTLTPGTGKVKYTFPRTVGAGKLRSLQLQPRPRDDRYVSVSKSVARDLDAEDHVRKQYSHSYYTKSSSCGFFTFTCTMVSGAEGRKKVCRPKIPTNPDGTPIRC